MSNEPIPVPDGDRLLTFNEAQSILATLQGYAREKANAKSVRNWQWVAQGALLLVLAVFVAYFYITVQATSHRLQGNCLERNEQGTAQRNVYRALAGNLDPTLDPTGHTTAIQKTLLDAADAIKPIDCSKVG